MTSAPIIDAPLLDALMRSSGFTRIETLAHQLGQTDAEVRHGLSLLRHAGCDLDEQPNMGVKLIRSGLGSWEDYLRWRLGSPARTIQIFEQVGSTQDAARRMTWPANRPRPCGSGALVVADAQTAGRGRLGRQWFAPPGKALLFSEIVTGVDGDPARAVDRLTFTTAVAVAQAIEAVASPKPDIRIKWPNDLLVEGRKLAGILVETFRDGGDTVAIVGVGVNTSVEPSDIPAEHADVRGRMTSLSVLGSHVDRLLLLSEIVMRMDAGRDDTGSEAMLAEWRRRGSLFGQEVQLQSNGVVTRCRIEDIDPAEGLIVRTELGTLRHFHAATTTIVRGA